MLKTLLQPWLHVSQWAHEVCVSNLAVVPSRSQQITSIQQWAQQPDSAANMTASWAAHHWLPCTASGRTSVVSTLKLLSDCSTHVLMVLSLELVAMPKSADSTPRTCAVSKHGVQVRQASCEAKCMNMARFQCSRLLHATAARSEGGNP